MTDDFDNNSFTPEQLVQMSGRELGNIAVGLAQLIGKLPERDLPSVAVKILELGIDWERARVCGQIVTRLADLDPGSPEAADLASLLQFVENKDATVPMEDT